MKRRIDRVAPRVISSSGQDFWQHTIATCFARRMTVRVIQTEMGRRSEFDRKKIKKWIEIGGKRLTFEAMKE